MLTNLAVMSVTTDFALSPHDPRSASRTPHRESATSNATRTRPHTATADTRHSYVTHLTEDGVDRRFIQSQVGHECDSSTAIYTHVSDDYMNTALLKALSPALTPFTP
ncbi:tyrosine-type recombinase/integrase [Nocardia sp. NPDC050630]|uniref:tyrosine-type recombinase/integrase n=1 Tax=Nocardia sp. NPDC050630 TaxID=3364321 RepID=UPI0037A89A62